MESLYIIIPAYNEEANITSCIRSWYSIIDQHNGGGSSRLVVIDDGSRDHTYALAKQCETDHPLLTVLTKPNEGHGATVLYGYRYALEHGADLIFQTDSDGQTNPAEFERFWRVRNRYDAVIGNRYDRKDGAARVFIENTLLLLIRLVFRVRMPDSNAPFRLMKAGLLRRYLPLMPKNYNLPNVLLTTFFVYFREPVAFGKISFQPRHGGRTSINMKSIFRIGIRAVRDFIIIKRHLPKCSAFKSGQ